MRQIKFRGKRADNGEWVYGYYVLEHEDINTIHVFDRGSTIIRLVLPHTVGQYTGLKDKDGTEIYEGDIVQSYAYDKAIVRWDNHHSSFDADVNGETYYLNKDIGNDYDIVVIGNTHE